MYKHVAKTHPNSWKMKKIWSVKNSRGLETTSNI